MKKFILSLIIVVLLPFYGYTQTLVQTFVDPCTKVVSTFVIPLTGNTVIVFYNKSKIFSAADVRSGAFNSWLNQVYEDYRKLSPCSVAQTTATTTQITAGAVSSAVSAAASTAASAAASSAASQAASSAASSASSSAASSASSSAASSATSSGSSSQSSNGSSTESSNSNSSSNESSSESSSSESESGGSEESSSESEGESEGGGDSKSKSKGGSKGAARVNPILFNSDFTAGQSLNNSFAVIMTGGISQSSMTGQSSWGVTAMVWSNFQQFALSSRYTAMHFDEGKLTGISNFGLTAAYAFGTTFGFGTYAYIYPMGKWGVAGANVTVAFAGAEYLPDPSSTPGKQMSLTSSILLFYTKPFTVNRRITLSPDVYFSGSPLVYLTKEGTFTESKEVNILTGLGVDYSFTSRFKLNIGVRTSISSSPDIPMLFFGVIGSKINL
jgi:hypothetical protein